MSKTTSPQPDSPADPTLEVAERQLAMLGELAEIAMGVSRAFSSSAVASAKAAEAILADEYFVPEVGRARACGAKDAAESFQKAARAVRLTLKLEMAVAETLRDIRAGIVTRTAPLRDAGGTPADLETNLVRRRLAGPCSDDETRDRDRYDSDSERLVDIERPDILPRAPFRETVDRICADLGVPVDWTTWKVGQPALKYEALPPGPPIRPETRPPPSPPPGAGREIPDPDAVFPRSVRPATLRGSRTFMTETEPDAFEPARPLAPPG